MIDIKKFIDISKLYTEVVITEADIDWNEKDGPSKNNPLTILDPQPRGYGMDQGKIIIKRGDTYYQVDVSRERNRLMSDQKAYLGSSLPGYEYDPKNPQAPRNKNADAVYFPVQDVETAPSVDDNNLSKIDPLKLANPKVDDTGKPLPPGQDQSPEDGAEASGNVEPRPGLNMFGGDINQRRWDKKYGDTHNTDGTLKNVGRGDGNAEVDRRRRDRNADDEEKVMSQPVNQIRPDLKRYIELLDKLDSDRNTIISGDPRRDQVVASYDFRDLITLVESKLLNEQLTQDEMEELKALHTKMQGYIGIDLELDDKIVPQLNRYLKLTNDKEPADTSREFDQTVDALDATDLKDGDKVTIDGKDADVKGSGGAQYFVHSGTETPIDKPKPPGPDDGTRGGQEPNRKPADTPPADTPPAAQDELDATDQAQTGTEPKVQPKSMLGSKLDTTTPNLMKAYNKGGKKPMSAIKNMQTALSRLGFDPNGLDGKYGPGTFKAVQAFQKANNLNVDGQAGPTTMKQLQAKLNKK
tara:strand:+ start:3527 stop:5101 length:1575 start_codon:yes stop_codon:yes gene_type:complete